MNDKYILVFKFTLHNSFHSQDRQNT